jgi:hypothetical protein
MNIYVCEYFADNATGHVTFVCEEDHLPHVSFHGLKIITDKVQTDLFRRYKNEHKDCPDSPIDGIYILFKGISERPYVKFLVIMDTFFYHEIEGEISCHTI